MEALQEIEEDFDKNLIGLLNFKDNIFGQIIEFLRSLLESLLQYLKTLNLKIWKSQELNKNDDLNSFELFKQVNFIFFIS